MDIVLEEKGIYHDGKYYTQEQMRDIVHEYYQTAFKNKNDRHLRMQKLFPSDIPQRGRILDYGCGMGGVSDLFSKFYSSKEVTVDSMDIDENQLAKAKSAFSDNPRINFILSKDFSYPESEYDLIFSSQVIEHVHNVGNYLSNINKMLKDCDGNRGGYLLIGLPNVITPFFVAQTLFFNNRRGARKSKNMLDNYYKPNNHINAWDATTFVTLLASMGFEFVEWMPTEGVPFPGWNGKPPWLEKIFPCYINKNNRSPFGRFSYTMFFLFRKVKNVMIDQNM